MTLVAYSPLLNGAYTRPDKELDRAQSMLEVKRLRRGQADEERWARRDRA